MKFTFSQLSLMFVALAAQGAISSPVNEGLVARTNVDTSAASTPTLICHCPIQPVTGLERRDDDPCAKICGTNPSAEGLVARTTVDTSAASTPTLICNCPIQPVTGPPIRPLPERRDDDPCAKICGIRHLEKQCRGLLARTSVDTSAASTPTLICNCPIQSVTGPPIRPLPERRDDDPCAKICGTRPVPLAE